MTIGYGNLVRTRRKELKMSQQELAELACVNRKTIIAMEREARNTRLDVFLSVLNALDLKLDIFAIEEEQEDENAMSGMYRKSDRLPREVPEVPGVEETLRPGAAGAAGGQPGRRSAGRMVKETEGQVRTGNQDKERVRG